MDQGPVIDLSSDVSPSAADDGTAVFAAERRRLTGIAYRIIGSLADAEDVVQEAWLRFSKTRESETIER
ncbi:MAG TPA: sigma factor, partial [Acidimicrobiia bacterium]|nr:sigma factor [Acidimicrobiia bacterium]